MTSRPRSKTNLAYWDDAKGGHLDPMLVRQARKEEITEIHNYKVYATIPIAECSKVNGKKPMPFRRLILTKGIWKTECIARALSPRT